jgi:molecular chaperone DnaK (HSP70)
MALISFEIQMLCSVSNPDVGGRDIDFLLAKHFAAVFEKNTCHDAQNDSQAWLRLLLESEKFKQRMSGQDTAPQPFFVRSLMKDADLSSSMDRFIQRILVHIRLIPDLPE